MLHSVHAITKKHRKGLCSVSISLSIKVSKSIKVNFMLPISRDVTKRHSKNKKYKKFLNWPSINGLILFSFISLKPNKPLLKINSTPTHYYKQKGLTICW